MKLSFMGHEIRVRSSNPAVGIYYALPMRPEIKQLLEAASTVGLTYEELGQLTAITGAENQIKAAEHLGL